MEMTGHALSDHFEQHIVHTVRRTCAVHTESKCSAEHSLSSVVLAGWCIREPSMGGPGSASKRGGQCLRHSEFQGGVCAAQVQPATAHCSTVSLTEHHSHALPVPLPFTPRSRGTPGLRRMCCGLTSLLVRTSQKFSRFMPQSSEYTTRSEVNKHVLSVLHRAPGDFVGMLVIESIMERVAAALCLDPLTVRERNMRQATPGVNLQNSLGKPICAPEQYTLPRMLKVWLRTERTHVCHTSKLKTYELRHTCSFSACSCGHLPAGAQGEGKLACPKGCCGGVQCQQPLAEARSVAGAVHVPAVVRHALCDGASLRGWQRARGPQWRGDWSGLEHQGAPDCSVRAIPGEHSSTCLV